MGELNYPTLGAKFQGGRSYRPPSAGRGSSAAPVVAIILLLTVQAKSSRGLRAALGESELESPPAICRSRRAACTRRVPQPPIRRTPIPCRGESLNRCRNRPLSPDAALIAPQAGRRARGVRGRGRQYRGREARPAGRDFPRRRQRRPSTIQSWSSTHRRSGGRRRRTSHQRVYRWTQACSMIAFLAGGVSVVCTMADDVHGGPRRRGAGVGARRRGDVLSARAYCGASVARVGDRQPPCSPPRRWSSPGLDPARWARTIAPISIAKPPPRARSPGRCAPALTSVRNIVALMAQGIAYVSPV